MPSTRATFLRTIALCALLFLPRSATAQLPPAPLAPTYSHARDAGQATMIEPEDRRSGPRIGAAYLIGGSVTAEDQGVRVQPMMSLFGWQVEHPFPTGVKGAPLPIVELIGLVGGLEQSRPLASWSFILGVRQPSGWEAGLGPTFTGAGSQLTFAAGITRAIGLLNFPLNLAVTPGRRGASVSLTTGFTRHAQ